jgi:rhomboid protease GluP
VTPDSQSEPVFLPTRSYRRAEEWSLVLVSQGIESHITQDDRGWGLLVSPDNVTRSVRILQVYERENRHWFRYFQPPPDTPGFHPGVVLWALLLVLLHAWQAVNPELRERGVCDTAHLLQGEVWRLWTAVSLHADLRHLMGNLVFGFLLLGLAMARFGAGWAQLAALLGGVSGNVVSAAVHGLGHRLLGASGMVMAALGLLAVGSIGLHTGKLPLRTWLVRGLLASVLLFLLLGLDPTSDVIAHAARFVTGLALGVPLRALPDALRTSRFANQLTALATFLAMLVAWAVALAR